MKFNKYVYILISMLILVSGLYAQQPVASVNPDSLNATIVACDDSVTLPVTIYNTGAADLSYNIAASYSSVPSGYCVPVYTWCCPEGCGDGDVINNFTFNTLSNLNSNCNGQPSAYIHYTSDQFTTTVLPGGTYSVTMQAGSWSEGFAIWIDYNRDGDFNDANEYVYSSPNASTSQFSTNITIPLNATLGKTRLRVRCAYNSVLTAADTCSSFSYGECEDYDISIGVPFVSCNPVSGTIIPGDSAVIQVKFKSAGLLSGNYLNIISITTNDTLNPLINIPCVLNLIGEPTMLVSFTNLNFDTIMQGATKKDTLIITNVGCSDLNITDITNLLTAFSVDTTILVIPPGDSHNIIVTFNPQSLGHFYDTLHVLNNDSNINVALHGYASEPPAISWSPTSFNASVNTCNDSVTVPMTIYNTGTFPLDWNFSNSIEKSMFFNGSSYITVPNTTGLPTGSIMTVEAWVYPTSYADLTYNGVVSFGPRWCTGSSFLLSMTNAGRPSFASWCNDFVPSTGPFATLNTWHHIAAVLNGNQITLYLDDYSWTTTLATVPNVTTGACLIGSTDATGRLFNGSIDDVRIWNTARTASEISHNRYSILSPQAGLVAYWNFNSGNASTVNDLTGNGHPGNITGAARIPDSPLNNIVNANPISNSIINGDSSQVVLTFSANNMISGTYNGYIYLSSNDPLHLYDSIPYVFDINGYPLISSSVNCLEFDSLLQFSIKKDSLWIYNTGCDTLNVSNISFTTANFSINTTSMAIYPGDSSKLVVTFNPQVTGHIYDTLHVVSDDTNLDICLHGYSLSPPIYSTNTPVISATINVCGDSAIVPVTIYNTGNYPLHYSINAGTILPSLCSPITTGYCCQMGIYNVIFNTIDNTTADGSEGYKDFTSTQQTLVITGQNYNLSVRTGSQYNEHVVAWIDFNNNGVFEVTEKIMESISVYMNHTSNVLIPSDAVMNTPLRMRIMSDYTGNSIPQACVNVGYGQCEDYSVIIGNDIQYNNPVDTVAPGDSSIVDVIFYSDNIISGIFTGNIVISSNDPLYSIDSIPYTLTYNGYPIINASVNCLTLDSILEFNSVTDSIYIYNIGCDSLDITDITNLNPAFTVDTTKFKILPGDSAMLYVTFNPQVLGDIYDTLHIINNDVEKLICLYGYSINPPVISHSPDSILAVINTCGDSATFPITIYNTGSYDLIWDLSTNIGALSDDFEPDIDNSLWSTINGGIASANCSYYSAGNALYFNSGSLREAISRSFNTLMGGQIEFYLRIGTGASPCENADSGEDVKLQYSIDNGNTWVDINTYLADNFPSFTLIQENIPPAAKTLNTMFKWTQPNNSGTGSDNWALDNVNFNGLSGSYSVDSVAGSVLPGDSAIINVTVHSEGLNTGVYSNSIFINSNDPLTPIDTINSTLILNGYPVIAFSDSCIALDSIIQFTSTSKSITIYNTGCDSLFISDIIKQTNEFSIDTNMFAINSGDSAVLFISFNPSITGDVFDTLTFINNDTNLTICLYGYAYPPPTISHNPDTLTATLGCSDSTTLQLTYYNTGSVNLSITDINDFSGVPPLFYDNFEDGVFNGWGNGTCVFTNTVTNVLPAVGSKCLKMVGGCNTHYQGPIYSFGTSTPTYVSFWAKSGSTTLSDAYFVIGENALNTSSQMAFFYMNNSGTMGLAGPGILNPYNANQWYHVEFRNVNYSSRVFDYYVDDILVSANVPFRGTNVTNSEVRIYNYNSSTSYFDEIVVGYGPIGQQWLQVDTTSATIATNDSVIINVNLSSQNLLVGQYNTYIVASSNDPLNPFDSVPVILTVVGNPVIELSDSCLAFDSIIQYTSQKDSISIKNTGCDSLFITDITQQTGEFSINSTAFAIEPGDSAWLYVIFNPALTGDIYDTLNIQSNAGNLPVCLHGYSLSPPIISHNPDSLIATINTCNDSITLPLTIYNSGDFPLTWNATIDAGAYFDDFEPDIDYSFWSSITGGVASASCSFFSAGNALYFDGNTRIATTKSFITTYGGIIEFYLKIGTGASPCENADFGEDVKLQYSVDNGNSWVDIRTYLADNYSNFTLIQEAIPVAAKTANTFFRWIQPVNSGSGSDNWAIDNVIFRNITNNMTFSTDTGTVAIADSAIINVTFHSNGLNTGVFNSNIIINSNDPLTPYDTIPTTLYFNGIPMVSLSDTCLIFDTIVQFQTISKDLTVYNTGCDTLYISNVTSDLPEFTTADTIIMIPHGDSAIVSVQFTPLTIGDFSGSLSIFSNTSTETVCLKGVSLSPPHITFNPTSLSANITACNDTFSTPLTIYNVGDYNLIYSIGGTSILSPLCTPITTSNCCGIGIARVQLNTIDNSTADGSDSYKDYSSTIQTSLQPGTTYPVYVKTGTIYAENVRIWIDYNNNGIFEASEKAFESANQMTNHNGTITIPTTAALQTPLRMRVGSELATNPMPQPCTNVQYGQFEDYKVTIGNGISYTNAVDTILPNDSSIVLVNLNALQATSGTFTYNVIISSNDPLSPIDTVPFNITIDPLPAKPVAADEQICFGATPPDLIATGTNVEWYSDPALTINVNSGNTFTTGESAVGQYYYYVNQTINNCSSPSDTVILSINPVYNLADNQSICDGDSYIFGTQTLTTSGVYNETFQTVNGCDSIVTLTLTVNPVYSVNDAATICDGNSYILGTQTLTTSGVYVETLQTVNGCDSVVTFTLTVNPTYNLTDSTSITCGQTYTFGTQSLTAAGVYIETFQTVNSCDSVVTLTLTMIPTYTVTDNVTICDGDIYSFGTQSLTVAGTYNETFTAQDGCDSLVTLILNVNPVFATTDSVSITCGQTYTFGTQSLTTAGVYVETFSSVLGCDSVVTLSLYMIPSYNTTDSVAICNGSSYVFGTQTLTAAGIYTETFTAGDGCDSLVTLTLALKPTFATTDVAEICNGDSYTFGTQSLTTAGIYNEIFTAINGCDSVVTLTLTVNPTYNLTDNASICDGASYTFGTQTLTIAGDYTETFSSINGCDSTVTLTLSVNPVFAEIDSATICDGDVFVFGTQTLSTAGSYNETFASVNGCDSVVTLTLTVNPTFATNDSATICDGDSYVFGTQTLTTAGIYTEIFSAVNGCDSTVTFTLNVNPVYSEVDSSSITCGNSYTFGTQTLTTAGVYVETFSSINSCDSVVTLTLSMIPSYTSTDSATICDGDSYVFGTQTLTVAGVYNETFSAVDGCDSLVTFTLNVNPVYNLTDNASICDGGSYTFGTQTLAATGVYTEIFATINGCDSVVTLNFTVNPNFITTDSLGICDGDSYIFGTQTLTATGVYNETFSTVSGCDSLVTLTLTVNPIYFVTDSVAICDGDSYVFGTQTLTSTGVYNEIFNSIYGCDSVVTLTFHVNPVYSVLDTASIVCGGSYSFGTQTLTSAGNYIETFSTVNGCDSVVNLTLLMIPSYTTTDSIEICDGNSYIFGTQTLTVAGQYSEIFTAIDGCDSLVNLTLNVNPIYSETDSISITCGQTYSFGTQSITTAGVYTETFSTVYGCDSVVTLTVYMIPFYNVNDTVSICQGDSYSFGTQTLTLSGDYAETFIAVDGCDSLVNLNLVIKFPTVGNDAVSICDGDSYIFGTQTLTLSGTYNETFVGSNGCDSVVTLILTVNPTYANTDSNAICDGDSIIFGTQTLSLAGVYTETFASVYGCDSVVTLTLTVNPVFATTDVATICDGDSIIFGTQTLAAAGVYSETFTSELGCDSVVTLTLSVNLSYNISIVDSINCGGSYVLGTQTLTSAGIYTEVFATTFGCDSVVNLTLNMIPEFTSTDSATICSNDSVYFGNQYLSIAGVYNFTFSAVDGCDSLVTFTLNVNPSYSVSITDSISCGGSYTLGTQTLTLAGTYVEPFATANGCDSIVTLNLSVIPAYTNFDAVTICDGDSFVFGTQTLTYAGVYNETFVASDGCDSLVSLTLSVNPSYSDTINASINCGDSYLFAGQNLSIAGTYYDSLLTTLGCDSVKVLNLSINPEFSVSVPAEICDGDSLIFGTQTLTTAGTYLETFTAIDGCDSLVTLNLFILPVYNVSDNATICTGDSLIFGSQTLSLQGVYTEKFISSFGCDSTVTLTLTVNPISETTITDSISCGGSYLFAGQTITVAGTYYDTLMAANGCDSIVTLNLSMIPSFVTTDTGIICDGDTYVFGNQSLTTAGVYNETFVASNGCDSLVTLTLTVKPTPLTDILDSISCGETYSFAGQTLSVAGVYYDTLNAVNGCDSVVTLYLAMRPSFITSLADTICDGEYLMFGNDTLTIQGVYNHTLTAINGCDSLVTLTLTVTPLPATPVVADLSKCTGTVLPTFAFMGTNVNWYADSMLVILLQSGNSFTPTDSVAGTYNYYVTQSENGCTSLYETATLEIYQTPSAPISSNSGVCYGKANPIMFASGDNICWYSDMMLTDTLAIGNSYQSTEINVGTYTYYITQSSASCGVSAYTQVVFEISNPAPAPLADDVTVCFGEQVPDLTVLPPSSNVLWYSEPELVILVNSGLNFTTGNTNVGEYTYYIVQDYNGCISSVGNVTLTINPKPLVTLDKYNVNINKGDSVIINAFNADSYSWSPSLGLNNTTGSQVIAKPENSITYVVSGTNSYGCTDTASCHIEVGQIGVEEASFAESVSVYPNPVSSKLTIEYHSSYRDVLKINIYNTLNQIIFSKEVVAENGNLIEIIDFDNLPDALYNLQIIKDNSVVNKKIVLKH